MIVEFKRVYFSNHDQYIYDYRLAKDMTWILSYFFGVMRLKYTEKENVVLKPWSFAFFDKK